MKILYICNGFILSKVHELLIESLTKVDPLLEIILYVPINYRNIFIEKDIKALKIKNVKILYSKILKPWHRLFYKNKITIILSDIEKQVANFSDISLIHSTTLCFDGALAYELHKKYCIPFTSTIRNTDVNSYFRFFIFYKKYFYKILEASSMVFFISKQYKIDFIKNVLPAEVSYKIKDKSIVIPNGIDNIFLNNRNNKINLKKDKIRIVYVGGILKNKNIINTLKAIHCLRKEKYNIEYTAIGSGSKNVKEGVYAKDVKKYEEKYEWFYLKDRVSHEELLKVYKDYDIFVMVSHKETFGLVYVEALSQGLPIVYSEGQGFDNTFDEGIVGFHAKSKDVIDIKNKIKEIIDNYNILASNISKISFNNFSWIEIAKQYIKIFKSLIIKQDFKY